MKDELRKTPLYDTHLALGGRMVEFFGWSMPVSFAGITEEHVHTRTACSVFDVSHMGRLSISGEDADAFLDRLCTRNLAKAEPGRSYYTHICKEDGGVLDDVIASRFENHWGVVCNGANRTKIVNWIEQHSADYNVSLKDETLDTAMLAIQGPKTMDMIREVAGQDLADLKRYRFTTFDFMAKISVYRCGYTGEDGVEVVLPAGMVGLLSPKLLGTKDAPHPVIKPAGLGARDTLRIEAGMPLYGHELGEDIDSLTGGQAWCVDLNKDFIGVEPMRDLAQRGLPRQLVGLELDGRRIARHKYAVYGNGSEIGEITSGTMSPTLGKSIAMAFVDSGFAEVGTELEVDFKGRRQPARVVKLPFYKRPKPS